MADYKLNVFIDDTVGDGDGLFGVAGIIEDDCFELAVIDTARGIDAIDSHLGADELHVTVLCDRACDGAGEGDPDVVSGHRKP